MLDVGLAKFDLANHMQRWVELESFDRKTIDLLKHITQHETYRALVGYEKHSASIDMTWLSQYCASGQQIWRLYEMIVFKNELDGSLKVGIKSGRTTEELFQLQPIQELLDEVLETLKVHTFIYFVFMFISIVEPTWVCLSPQTPRL